MAEQWADVQKIFEEAFKRKPEDRAEFLDEACGDDADLRVEVETLIEHHRQASTGFMQPPDPNATVAVPLREPPPDPPGTSKSGGASLRAVSAWFMRPYRSTPVAK